LEIRKRVEIRMQRLFFQQQAWVCGDGWRAAGDVQEGEPPQVLEENCPSWQVWDLSIGSGALLTPAQ